jgi:hypothetical protein
VEDIVRLILWTVALWAAAGISASAAPAGDRTWLFSGNELIDALKGELAPEASDKELKRMLSTTRGSAYVAGVADALQGKAWCGAGAILPHEMTDRVFTYLSDLPPEKRQGNAAALVGEALSKEFPCPGGTKQ